ncbi:DUF982 domain-containing protein (plasmid) [Ensifer adhaerens]|uniref:DUF982 domain-containing protein n=1 Tax=Ensifer adhaerens TaxID=106592 RepID=UPI001CBE1EC0|nr:DUF982 domain-containing protein [Ensifer adhaerens]MBZ7927145.1 DUF982 domain-containing protein [Ensifer adhaerens]UAX98183.1 DUF982 domain-containing protein [Ensifer adhaerens]UAY05565.1 DUF982 domain-containing protein [Ensifer adhaerens]UAY12943.1 DUF982 domain-containing protein [Ensifer adhaerens]
MYLPEMPWSVPLQVTFQNGNKRTFSSVFDALVFLETEWPRRRGRRYEQAVEVCRRVLNRTAPVAIAREAFVAACLEAGLPANGLAHRTRPISDDRRSAA